MQRAIELLRVGFDLDGVLSRTEQSTFAALKAAGWIPPDASLDELCHFNWSASFPSVPEGVMDDLFAEGEVFRSAPCNPEALDCLNALSELGVETHIVTHRPWDRARVETAEWLATFEARYSHLTLVEERADKADYCRLHGLDVFIEDNLATATMLTDYVRLSMLFDRTYNRASPALGYAAREARRTVKRFYRFDEVLTFFGIKPL